MCVGKLILPFSVCIIIQYTVHLAFLAEIAEITSRTSQLINFANSPSPSLKEAVLIVTGPTKDCLCSSEFSGTDQGEGQIYCNTLYTACHF